MINSINTKKYFACLMVCTVLLIAGTSFSSVYAQSAGGNQGSGTSGGNQGSGTSGGNQGSGTSGGAVAPNSNVNIGLDNPFGDNNQTIEGLFQTILSNIIIPIGAVLAVLAFIYAGFLYVMAAGNDKKLEVAHKALLYAAIGTAVLLGASVIAEVLKNTINQLQ